MSRWSTPGSRAPGSTSGFTGLFANGKLGDDLLHPRRPRLRVGAPDDVGVAKPEVVPDGGIEVVVVELTRLLRQVEAFLISSSFWGDGPREGGETAPTGMRRSRSERSAAALSFWQGRRAGFPERGFSLYTPDGLAAVLREHGFSPGALTSGRRGAVLALSSERTVHRGNGAQESLVR